ncbi:hypothetical protein TEA_020584 [Camellia sinensis var. sinensis]|uniref:Uncharacterized protein n=1 Tax=Camellia sinensis var. sinensis TaxID=542762 RepID=A0A4S4EJU9_CAMSN|nr:hypothetical protein TEA_020584 [Camellia sinensis var. sinensis]
MATAASAPVNKIERAHQMYREGLYEEALGFYTEALGLAKTKSQKIALHSNRAACFLKLHDFKQHCAENVALASKMQGLGSSSKFFHLLKIRVAGNAIGREISKLTCVVIVNEVMAAEECTSVLVLDHDHTGALMLRAQTLVTLKEYHSALFDVNRLTELNPSSEVYRNLQSRKSLAPIPEAEAEFEEEDENEEEDESKEEAEPKRDEEEIHEENDLVDSEVEVDQMSDRSTDAEVSAPQTQSVKGTSEQNSKGWQTIPKPKGHSQLDYSRWDRVEDESSEEEDDDDDEEESQPQYRFRVRTVGVRPVK